MRPVPAAGVPLRVAVPLRLSTNVTPAGRAPLLLSAGAGEPVALEHAESEDGDRLPKLKSSSAA